MPDKLALWVDSAASTVARIPLGIVPAGTSEDFPFRILNASTTYTATDVTITVHGAQASSLYLSEDGRTFSAALSLGDLPPSVRSPILYFRRVTPTDASGPADVTLRLTCAGWAA